jgi:hypothetical protein
MRTTYLPVTVHDLPSQYAFQPDGKLRDKVRHAVDMKVVRVIAGPEKCHVIIDVQRPYHRAITA